MWDLPITAAMDFGSIQYARQGACCTNHLASPAKVGLELGQPLDPVVKRCSSLLGGSSSTR
eukprot:3712623-Pyramimonas_sp.AAC.1